MGLTVALTAVFVWIEGNPDGIRPFPLPHAMLASTSLALLCLILMLGPAAQFVPRLRPVVPFGRELGIAMFVTAGLHVALLTDFKWEVSPFFGARDLLGDFEFGMRMWDSANWVGAVALGYGVVLVAISNDWSQRKLGRGWKFLQRQAYTLFVLVWLHTAAFVVIGAGHGAMLRPWLFWVITAAVVVLQVAGFVHTVRGRRGPSRHGAAARRSDPGRGTATARWIAVVGLWAAVMGGAWQTTRFTTAEERLTRRVCDRSAELSGLPIEDRREELRALLADAGMDPRDFNEIIEECG